MATSRRHVSTKFKKLHENTLNTCHWPRPNACGDTPIVFQLQGREPREDKQLLLLLQLTCLVAALLSDIHVQARLTSQFALWDSNSASLVKVPKLFDGKYSNPFWVPFQNVARETQQKIHLVVDDFMSPFFSIARLSFPQVQIHISTKSTCSASNSLHWDLDTQR